MIHKNLIDILTQLGWVRDGSRWAVPPGDSATVYLAFDEEALIIDRVVSIDAGPEFAVLVTQRKERYATELSSVLAVRVVAHD